METPVSESAHLNKHSFGVVVVVPLMGPDSEGGNIMDGLRFHFDHVTWANYPPSSARNTQATFPSSESMAPNLALTVSLLLLRITILSFRLAYVIIIINFHVV